jgi:hypothetical protein
LPESFREVDERDAAKEYDADKKQCRDRRWTGGRNQNENQDHENDDAYFSDASEVLQAHMLQLEQLINGVLLPVCLVLFAETWPSTSVVAHISSLSYAVFLGQSLQLDDPAMP